MFKGRLWWSACWHLSFPSSYVSRIMFRVIPSQQVCLDQGEQKSACRHQISREELRRWLPGTRLSLSNAVQCYHQSSPRHLCGYRRPYERQPMPVTKSLMASVFHHPVNQSRSRLCWQRLLVFHVQLPRLVAWRALINLQRHMYNRPEHIIPRAFPRHMFLRLMVRICTRPSIYQRQSCLP